jgi:hypothetical protein
MKLLNSVCPWNAGITFAAVVSVLALLNISDLAAEEAWYATAEARLKAIYDRGEFRAKAFRPTWLNDSSGFVVEEPDSTSGKPTQWFHDVTTGARRVWESDGKQLVQKTPII